MARTFNGTTDRIDWASIFTTSGQALSVSLWVQIDVLNPAQTQYWWTAEATGPTVGTLLGQLAGVNGVLVFFRNGNITGMQADSPASTLAVGRWTHVVVTSDGSQTAANNFFWVNGMRLGRGNDADGTGGDITASGTWSLGGRVFDDARNTNAQLADVGVWNRVLSAQEIVHLSQRKSPEFVPWGLRFHAPLDGWSPERNLLGAAATTMDGTSALLSPVPVRQPARRRLLADVAAAAPAGTKPYYYALTQGLGV